MVDPDHGDITPIVRGDRAYAVLMFLSTRKNRCATLDEIIEALEPLHRKTGLEGSRFLRQYVVSTLTRMKKRGLVESRWALVLANGEKKEKRIYCLRVQT